MKSVTSITASAQPTEIFDPPQTSAGSIIVLNGLLTLLIILFLSIPDGGILLTTALSGSFSYWLGAFIIGSRRAHTLTRGDRLYFFAGQVVCVALFLVALPIFVP